MGQFREQLENFDEREIDRIQAIIYSMTPFRAGQPQDHRRVQAGHASPRDRAHRQRRQCQLVDRFFEARKMMESMAKWRRHSGDARHAGHAGRGWWSRQAEGQAEAGQGRRVSGNPAKAAQAAKAAQEKAAQEKAANPFGNPGGEEIDYAKAAEQLNLPKGFDKFLK
jgi:signal recognition particle subunit SRP54